MRAKSHWLTCAALAARAIWGHKWWLVLGLAAMLFSQLAEAAPRPGAGTIATADGLRLYYRIEGQGSDRIVVLHGGPGLSSAYLKAVLAPLAASRTLIFYDQRGTGESSVTTDAMLLTVDRFVADLEAVRRHFGIDRVTLLGHSWGAGLAVLYAARYPDKVRRLILSDPMAIRRTPYQEQFERNLFAWMDEPTRSKVLQLGAAQHDAADPVAACRAFNEIFGRAYLADRDHFPPFVGGPCDMPPNAVRNSDFVRVTTMASLGDWDWRPQLRSIRIPALVIYGSQEPIPLESAREWADSLPNSSFEVIRNSGHFPFVERPGPYFEAIEKFLRAS